MAEAGTQVRGEPVSGATELPGGGDGAGPAAAWGLGLVCLLAVAIYLPTLQFRFVFDDVDFIVSNDRIRVARPLWDYFLDPMVLAPADPFLARDLYRPLTALSFRLNHILAGWLGPSGPGLPPEPLTFHLVNLALHVLNGALLWAWLGRLGASAPGRLFGTLLFLLHPVQVETVAWASQRSNLQGTACLLGALWLQLLPSLRSREWLLLALVTGAVFTKEQFVVLPVLLVVQELALGRHRPAPARQRLAGWIVLFVPVALYVTLRLALLGKVAQRVLEGDLVSHYLTSVEVFVLVTLRLFVWPWPLVPVRGFPIEERVSATLAGCVIVLAVLAWTLCRLGRGDRPALLGAVGWLLSLVPTANIVPFSGFAADRYLYFAMAFFCLLIGRAGPLLPPRARIGAALAVLGVAAGLTMTRLPAWSDDETLFSTAYADAPGDYLVQHYWALRCDRAGDVEQAARIRERMLGVRLPPSLRVNASVHLARYHLRSGRMARARPLIQQALAVNPDSLLARVADLEYRYLAAGGGRSARERLRHELAGDSLGRLLLDGIPDDLYPGARGGVEPEARSRGQGGR